MVANLALATTVALTDGSPIWGRGRWARQLSVTVGAIVGSGALTALAMRLPGLHRVYAAERVGSLPVSRRLAHLAVMVPLGTVIPEEVIFRGVLQRRWEEETGRTWGGILGSAVFFGLWHLGPSVAALARLRPQLGAAQMAPAVIWTVATTGLAGIGFGVLRAVSGGLAAPIGAHLAVNLVGSLAGRRLVSR